MLLLLLIQLCVQLERLDLEPVDPSAQTCDMLIVHEGPLSLVLLLLQKEQLLAHLAHLVLIRLLEIGLVRLQLLLVVVLYV